MRSATILPALFLVTACSGSDAATATSSAPGSRSFAVGAFDAVSLEGSANVVVLTGDAVGVTARGAEKELDLLDIRVDGTTLKIGRKRTGMTIGWSDANTVTVTVNTRGIVGAAIAGSGNMNIDRVRGARFKGAVGGSGDMLVKDAQVTRADVNITGSGNIAIAGSASESALSVAGSGDIDAEKLQSRTAEVSIVGSGDIRANASGSATLSLVGSGDATVKGTKDCSISKLGSGKGRCEP